MDLNKLNNNSIKEQRENLLRLNNDLLYWVYSLKEESDTEIKLDYLGNILTCYPNQLDNLKWINENTDITIVNLFALRKWKIEILSWKKQDISNPILLSNWVIEFIEAKNYKWDIKKHLISTLRDWWATDELQRTTTAWRNSWNDLHEDLEREHIEESPFLWYNEKWELSLAIINNSEKSKEILKESINFFLENKYLKKWDSNFKFVKKNFERNFSWIKYEELGKILNDIIENERITTYNSDSIEKLDWIDKNMKKISLWNTKWKYFVYFDKNNNTIEYRLLRTITWFNDWFKLLSKRPSRLYLESENQYPRVPRIENASNWYVPTINYFSGKIEKIILNEKFNRKNIFKNIEKPNPKYMLQILATKAPDILKYHKRIYDKKNNKYNSFEEYIYSQYWQLWSSKSVDAKSKKEDWEYYSREEYLNHKWSLVKCDIYRESWDIYEFCKKHNITDLKFEWWWFNMH